MCSIACVVRQRNGSGIDHEHAARFARLLTVARDLGLDEVVEHFTLIGNELDQVRAATHSERRGARSCQTRSR